MTMTGKPGLPLGSTLLGSSSRTDAASGMMSLLCRTDAHVVMRACERESRDTRDLTHMPLRATWLL